MLAGGARANPVLIAGGAIAYGGAVVYENRKVIADAGKRAWNDAQLRWGRDVMGFALYLYRRPTEAAAG